jgi:hypothetical protein
MNITKEQQQELEVLVKPLQEWMNNNCHPHVVAVVDSENMELLKGITTVQRTQRGSQPFFTSRFVFMYAFNPSPASARRFMVTMCGCPMRDERYV